MHVCVFSNCLRLSITSFSSQSRRLANRNRIVCKILRRRLLYCVANRGSVVRKVLQKTPESIIKRGVEYASTLMFTPTILCLNPLPYDHISKTCKYVPVYGRVHYTIECRNPVRSLDFLPFATPPSLSMIMHEMILLLLLLLVWRTMKCLQKHTWANIHNHAVSGRSGSNLH